MAKSELFKNSVSARAQMDVDETYDSDEANQTSTRIYKLSAV